MDKFQLVLLVGAFLVAFGAIILVIFKREQGGKISSQLEYLVREQQKTEDSLRIQLGQLREELAYNLKDQRTELSQMTKLQREELVLSLKNISDSIVQTLRELSQSQKIQLDDFSERVKNLVQVTETKLETLRLAVERHLKEIIDYNTRQLEQIRITVDEKLSSTLEKRLGDSFKLVSERLEAVHKGLGEMQGLAAGIGDLKRVLSNVKIRGTWAEVQLGQILEQILTPELYAKNVQVVPSSDERVEFAIKLPGPKEDKNKCVWLPIDSKFPQEDYIRLQEAHEKAEPEAINKALEGLVRSAKQAAKDINQKYISPPYTTDFAIMFLPTEGLYGELLRQPGLVEELQQRYRVILAGPTTIAAILCGLRMGFHTLAIEQRASEVWKLLQAVRTEFKKFGELLERLKRHLQMASKTLDDTDVRTRVMERRLKDVTEIPLQEAELILRINGEKLAKEEEEL